VKKKHSIAILGCGSVGSFLSMEVAKGGTDKIMLMDNEILAPENVVRHLCSLDDASKELKKVITVESVIRNKFPKINCISCDDDILEYLHKKECKFNNYDIIVSCVGNLSVERRLDFAVKHNIFCKDLIYLWVEPYAIAGHILYIPRNKAGTLKEHFTDKGDFKYSVLNNAFVFSRRETGCQSSFIPYSSDELEQFVIYAGKIINELIGESYKESVLYSWLGNLRMAYEKGLTINNKYIDCLPYTTVRNNLDI